MKKNKPDKALKVLCRIRRADEQEVGEELEEIVSSTKNSPDEGILSSLKIVFTEWRIFQR